MTKYAIRYTGPNSALVIVRDERHDTPEQADASRSLRMLPDNWEVVAVNVVEAFSPMVKKTIWSTPE